MQGLLGHKAAQQDSPIGVVPTLEVTSAEYVDGYKIRVSFNTGQTGIIILENPRLCRGTGRV